MTLSEQIRLVVSMLLAGVVLGFFYEGYVEWLSRKHRNRIVVALVDVWMWMLGALFVFALLQIYSYGVFRAVVFLAQSVGLIVYFNLLRRPCRVIWKSLFRIVTAIFELFVLKWWRILQRLWKRKGGGNKRVENDKIR